MEHVSTVMAPRVGRAVCRLMTQQGTYQECTFSPAALDKV